MEATSYSLQGNTPQPFLEELCCSLPVLEQLAASNATEGLNKRFWARMFDALLRTIQAILFSSGLKEDLERDVLFAPISMLAASVLVAISPTERAAALQEEVCGELKMTKVNFDAFPGFPRLLFSHD